MRGLRGPRPRAVLEFGRWLRSPCGPIGRHVGRRQPAGLLLFLHNLKEIYPVVRLCLREMTPVEVVTEFTGTSDLLPQTA